MSPGQVFYLVLFLTAELLALVLMLVLIWVRRLALQREVPTPGRVRVLFNVNIASFAVVLVLLPVVLVYILTRAP